MSVVEITNPSKGEDGSLVAIDIKVGSDDSIYKLKELIKCSQESCPGCKELPILASDTDFNERIKLRVRTPLAEDNIFPYADVIIKCKHCGAESQLSSILDYSHLDDLNDALSQLRDRFKSYVNEREKK